MAFSSQFQKNNGFTLMEVLIALVITSLAFTTVFMSMSYNAKNLLYLQDKTAANWVALNVIAAAQLRLINISKSASVTSGSERMFNTIWYWDAIVSPTENLSISRIDVAVRKMEDSPNIIQLTGYLRDYR